MVRTKDLVEHGTITAQMAEMGQSRVMTAHGWTRPIRRANVTGDDQLGEYKSGWPHVPPLCVAGRHGPSLP
jgi:hypothetical protein